MTKIVVPCLVFLLAACSSSPEETPPVVDCASVQPVPTFNDVQAFANVCSDCHSSSLAGDARHGAPSSINFDDYASAAAHARQAAIEVNVGAMPPASAKESLTDSQKTDLFDWAMCGTPE